MNFRDISRILGEGSITSYDVRGTSFHATTVQYGTKITIYGDYATNNFSVLSNGPLTQNFVYTNSQEAIDKFVELRYHYDEAFMEYKRRRDSMAQYNL